MTKRANTKFYIILGIDPETGESFAVQRDMGFDKGSGYYIFAKRESAEKEARYYKWASAGVFSLQGIAYKLNNWKDHQAAKKLALATLA